MLKKLLAYFLYLNIEYCNVPLYNFYWTDKGPIRREKQIDHLLPQEMLAKWHQLIPAPLSPDGIMKSAICTKPVVAAAELVLH